MTFGPGSRLPGGALRGKRVASPEFQLTAGVWIRGILAEHHGVPIDSVTYFTGGQETPGRIEKGRVATGLDIRPIPADATLSQMLADGRIDALQGADQTILEAGETITVVTPTGGGYGEPG